MSTTTLTSKGQITLPKEVRDHFHLGEGDRLDFVIASDGTVQVQPVVASYRELRGLMRKPRRPAPSDADLEREVASLLAAEDARIRRVAG
ncbi:MAG TPA: AbrB/MazE/SpoVT family DNA-binding domain-containing protein [Thermoanaerobaculia bacterium]